MTMRWQAYPKGIANPDDAAIITLIAKGLCETCIAFAKLRAIGIVIAAAALLVTISVRTRAIK
jgi:hypothetical protein